MSKNVKYNVCCVCARSARLWVPQGGRRQRGQDARHRASACWHRGERVALGGGEKWPTTAVAQHHAVQRPRRGEHRSNGNVAASDSYRAGIATGGSCVGAPGALLALISSLAPGATCLPGQRGVPGHRVRRADRGRGAQDGRARVLRRRRCPAGHSCGRGAAGCAFYRRVGRRKHHEGRIHASC